MKILIVDPHYPNFLVKVYADHPEARHWNYERQKQLIWSYCFGTSDFYSRNLKPLGWQAEEVIPNCEPLQKAWACEHGVRYKKNYLSRIPKLRKLMHSDWQDRILEAQLKHFDPDIIYSQELGVPSKDMIERIGIKPKLIVGQIASPISFNKERLGYYDLILTSFPHFVPRFREIGIGSEYFRIGFDPSVLDKLPKDGHKAHDAAFVGGISVYHAAAYETLEYAAKNSPVEFWGYGANKLPADSAIRAKHHGPAWGIDMYKILHDSKISVNRHIDVAENNANNMRLYESTGVGALLITDHKDNIGELFEVGKEIVTYKTKEELVEKINYYLNHEEERARIATAGQARTLRDHTYAARMKELVSIFSKHIKT